MGFSQWVHENWVDLLQSIGIIASLVFHQTDTKRDRTRDKVSNRIIFTQRHAEIWNEQASNPKLQRIKKVEVNLVETPVTPEEELFFCEVLHHFASTFYASERNAYEQPPALADDIRSFFKLPISKAVWEHAKRYQEPSLVAFVEMYF
jgi:hypothetical protein